jgi:hypothetical protein
MSTERFKGFDRKIHRSAAATHDLIPVPTERFISLVISHSRRREAKGIRP